MTAVKIRPWTEWKAKTRDWLVGIKVRITFDELARLFRRCSRRRPANDNHHTIPNPESKDHDDLP